MARKTYGYDRLIYVLEANHASKMTGVTPRDSDKELIIQMLQWEGCNLAAEQMEKIRRFNFESLTRARRKLQEKGEYPPSPGVARKRRLKAMIIQQTAPSESAAGLQRRIEEGVS
jgi:hypothetical protein